MTSEPAPTDPIRLAAHLEDEHLYDGPTLATFDSDDLRALHRYAHDGPGQEPDHDHPGGQP